MAIENHHSVVRNVGASKIRDDGTVDGSAFRIRPVDTDGLTVNWLDFFEMPELSDRLAEIRLAFARKQRKIGASSKFAELSVGDTISHVRTYQQSAISFVHCAEKDDDSHSGIMGYKPEDEIIADMIAETVKAMHPGSE